MPTEDAELGEAVGENPDPALSVARLADELAGLRADFAAKIRYDEIKERQIASMHEELQSFRAGLHLRLLQPMFTDLIAMHDDLLDALNSGNATSELESFKESVLETLSRNGVSRYAVESDEVDRARQRVISAVATSDETLEGHVRHRIRPGFAYDNGKVLRPEWVVAYRYTRAAEQQAHAAPAAGGE
ncbi:MAG TPA: nucleotide exchange factor GrpE [Pseudonocardiaceae bacterium]|nr:nucleotide exchange factor GrpE [Pseudonocardiaceae bacterium]